MSSLSGLLGRLFRRPDEAAVAAAVSTAVATVPGVTEIQVSYNHLQYGAGALSGLAELDVAATLDDVLRAAYGALADALGEDAERVVVYLSGRTPDGAAVTAYSLGLPVQPIGRDLARRYS
jgi:hypothetical protein